MPKTTSSPPALRRALALAASSLLLGLASLGGGLAAPASANGGAALRFYGTGAAELDRVMIPLGPLDGGQITSSFPVNVAGDLTLEFWMKAAATANAAPLCDAGWYYGNIIVDRDVDGAGDEGDYGVALCDGRIAFGVSVGDDDRQLLSAARVADDQWHHIAVTRADGGELAIFVDGQPAGSAAGPTGSIAYRAGRQTPRPTSDPFLVLGAEKHGYPGTFHYDGLLDDMRISNTVRYRAPFTRPTGPHEADAATAALYRFDEGSGTAVADSSGAPGGPSDGVLIVDGSPASPAWASDTPFTAARPAEAPPGAASPLAEPAATGVATTDAPADQPTATRPAVIPLPAATPIPPVATPQAPPATAAPEAAAATPAALAQATAATPAALAQATATVAKTMDGSPPPADNRNTVLYAWLAAGLALALAVVAGLRLRARG